MKITTMRKRTALIYPTLAFAAVAATVAAGIPGVRGAATTNTGQPVCDSSDGKCHKHKKEVDNDASAETPPDKDASNFQCGLYMVPSWANKANEETNVLTLYAGRTIPKGTRLSPSPDPVISFVDANKNEWSSWQEYFWRADLVGGVAPLLENHYYHDLFAPGLPSLAVCADSYRSDQVNAVPAVASAEDDAAGSGLSSVRRSKDPTAGSFAYRYSSTFEATRDIPAGREIVASCSVASTPPTAKKGTAVAQGENNDDSTGAAAGSNSKSIEWLEENGICIDTVEVRKSTLLEGRAGMGAFARRRFGAGDAILTSPVVVFDRSRVNVVEQRLIDPSRRGGDGGATSRSIVPNLREDHDVEYDATNVTGRQLLVRFAGRRSIGFESKCAIKALFLDWMSFR